MANSQGRLVRERPDALVHAPSLADWPDDVVAEVSAKFASASDDRMRSVSAAEVSFRITDADVRYLKWRDREIVRRIFVSVRDTQWREIPPSTWASAVRVDGGEVRAYFEASHTAGPISFRWRGVFTLDSGAHQLSFEVDGAADHDIEVNRVSVVVLHPLRTIVGGTLSSRGASESKSIDVSQFVHPQPIVDGAMQGMTPPFSELDIENEGGRLEFSVSGARFEIEDQRNYGDASFKSYSPPLSDGFPYRLVAGQPIHHSVRAHFSAGSVPRLPALGLDARSVGRSSSWSRARWFDFRRADVSTDRPGEHVRQQLAAPDVSDTDEIDDLEVGLVRVTDRTGDDVLAAIGETGRRARSILVSQRGSSIISATEANRLQQRLRDHGCVAPIIVAVDGHLAELNRGSGVELGGDGVGIVVCPTVHGGDALTVAENVPAVPDMVLTARQLTGAGQVSISQLTLERGPQPERDVYHQIAPAWLIATVEAAGRAGATSITLDAGVLPVVCGDDALSVAWSTVLDLLARARRSEPWLASIVAPADVHVISWSEGKGVEMLFANLSDRTRWVMVDTELVVERVTRVFAPFDAHEPVATHGVPLPGFGVTWVHAA